MMIAEYNRCDRIADLLQREIADLLLRRVKDPRIEGVTITAGKVSRDLQHARVFYCIMGSPEEERKEAVASGLEKARGFMRQELGKRLHMRHLPQLEFAYDASFDYGDKIERLLKALHKDE
jgi:ribosome-binding factor A